MPSSCTRPPCPQGHILPNGETPDEKSQMADFRLCVYLRSDVACRIALLKHRSATFKFPPLTPLNTHCVFFNAMLP